MRRCTLLRVRASAHCHVPVQSLRFAQPCSFSREDRQLATSREKQLSFGFISESAHSGGLRATRLLRRSSRKGPVTQMDVAEALGTETMTRVGTSPLELNLFEDPTGGLTGGAAEELTTGEMAAQVRLLTASYDPGVFYLLYTPYTDIFPLAHGEDERPRLNKKRKELPHGTTTSAAVGDASWLYDAATVLADPPRYTAGAMGEAAWKALRERLLRFYEPIEEVMPLTRVVRQHGLPEDVYVPFLRQLAMSLVPADSRRTTVALLPSLILGLANGRAPGILELPEAHTDRVLLVSELFLSVAQETGDTDMAYLGLQLLRANGVTVPFAFQKQLTNVFAASARLQTDWAMRASGVVEERAVFWATFTQSVHRANNAKAVAALQETGELAEGDKEDAEDEEDEKDDSPASSPSGAGDTARYFASRRPEDVARVKALERNVEAALKARARELQRQQKASEAPERKRN